MAVEWDIDGLGGPSPYTSSRGYFADALEQGAAAAEALEEQRMIEEMELEIAKEELLQDMRHSNTIEGIIKEIGIAKAAEVLEEHMAKEGIIWQLKSD